MMRISLNVLLFFLCLSGYAQSYVPEWKNDKIKVKPLVDIQAYSFNLGNVRLLESPFLHAARKDAAYLLMLEPDRLLYRFRENAGLKPNAAIYGGWESQGVSGQTLGHYLSACALHYAASGDEQFRAITGYVVNELALCQKARITGYVGAIPDEDRIWNEIAAGDIRSQGFDLNGGWVPWYTQHKVLAGLIDTYLYTNNKQALEVAIGLSDWVVHLIANLSDAQMEQMLACEFGGMNDVLANMYAITGKKDYLDAANRFWHHHIMDPLAARRDALDGKHANTQIPKIVGAARLYELTNDPKNKTVAEFFWNTVVSDHTYVIGGNSDHEHFGPPHKLNDRLSDNTTETCNTYNMLKLTSHLFAWNPAASYNDYYERALYNHILPSQNPHDGMMSYFVPLKMGGVRTYSTPFESFWCCVGTGIENHVKYGEHIYSRGKDSTLYVNLFIPSRLTWEEQKAVIRQETVFPESDTIHITVEQAGKGLYPINIRYPGWAAEGSSIAVNGTVIQPDIDNNYIRLKRHWKDGDRIRLVFKREIRTESMPDNPNRIAFLYGPLVLGGDLGKHADPAENPVIIASANELQANIRRLPDAFAFRMTHITQPTDVTLFPFYQITNNHYNVYWDLFTETEWEQRKAIYEAEKKWQQELDARTTDMIRIGEMQPERDHDFQGRYTETGDANGRKWRHATDGGWFSFTMAVSPQIPNSLMCTYWGSDSGNRDFEVYADDVLIGRQLLEQNDPDNFFDVIYTLPLTLTRDKQQVRITFKPLSGKIAGGLFGCRMVKSDQNLFVADPFILEDNGVFYLYGTSSRDGIVVWRSADLTSWDGPCGATLGLALHKADTWGERNFWAPEVFKTGNKYVMTYSVDEHIAIAESDSPLGPFKQTEVKPLLTEKGIDSHIFFDDDGTPYLYWVRFQEGNVIYTARMSHDLKSVDMSTAKLCITAAPGTWERTDSNPRANVAEGPFVMKHNGKYYLSYSCNHFQSPDYGVGWAVADHPEGPWIKSKDNPILLRHDGYSGTGHHAFLQTSSGKMYIVYHSHYDNQAIAPRRTLISECQWKNEADSFITIEAGSRELEKAVMYPNAVFEPCFADPTVVRATDGYFYAYATMDTWGSGVKTVPIIRSENLADWTYIGDAFPAKPEKIGKANIWAPDVTYHNGRYYMFYAYSTWGDPNPGIGHAASDTPQGPFTDYGKLFDSKEIEVTNSIDPAFFKDDDGRTYLTWGSFNGIYIIEIKYHNGKFQRLGKKHRIAGNKFEAPYILKRNGWYYQFLSAGSCCDGPKSTYHVRVGRSRELLGEYKDAEGRSLNDDKHLTGTIVLQGNNVWAGPGHPSQIVTDDNGTDWMLYHAVNKGTPYFSETYTRRPLLLDAVVWNNGWPEVRGKQPSARTAKPVFRKIDIPDMYFKDTSSLGVPFAKDPKIVYYKGKYKMYYSIPASDKKGGIIGIAESRDLTNWQKVGNLYPSAGYERNGLCAPSVVVRNDTLHLFYQTFGSGTETTVCHAFSTDDGVVFTRNATNPVFKPTGAWNNGSATKAEVTLFKEQYYLYFTTHDPEGKVQMQGVAVASPDASFNRTTWTQAVDAPVLKPELQWERTDIEAVSCIAIGDSLYMFYAGGHHGSQQIGVAVSSDGLSWQRLSDWPFLRNGVCGTWNESESGDPDIFRAPDGRIYLFFQGTNNKGKTRYVSKIPVNLTFFRIFEP